MSSGDRMTNLLDAAIEAARERGVFDDLPGRGKPLALDELDSLTPEQRFETLLARSFGEVLPEVALIRDVRETRSRMTLPMPDAERARLEAALQSKIEQLRQLLLARRASKSGP